MAGRGSVHPLFDVSAMLLTTVRRSQGVIATVGFGINRRNLASFR